MRQGSVQEVGRLFDESYCPFKGWDDRETVNSRKWLFPLFDVLKSPFYFRPSSCVPSYPLEMKARRQAYRILTPQNERLWCKTFSFVTPRLLQHPLYFLLFRDPHSFISTRVRCLPRWFFCSGETHCTDLTGLC